MENSIRFHILKRFYSSKNDFDSNFGFSRSLFRFAHTWRSREKVLRLISSFCFRSPSVSSTRFKPPQTLEFVGFIWSNRMNLYIRWSNTMYYYCLIFFCCWVETCRKDFLIVFDLAKSVRRGKLSLARPPQFRFRNVFYFIYLALFPRNILFFIISQTEQMNKTRSWKRIFCLFRFVPLSFTDFALLWFSRFASDERMLSSGEPSRRRRRSIKQWVSKVLMSCYFRFLTNTSYETPQVNKTSNWSPKIGKDKKTKHN